MVIEYAYTKNIVSALSEIQIFSCYFVFLLGQVGLEGTQSKVKIIALSSVAGAASKCACIQRINGLSFAWSTGSK